MVDCGGRSVMILGTPPPAKARWSVIGATLAALGLELGCYLLGAMSCSLMIVVVALLTLLAVGLILYVTRRS